MKSADLERFRLVEPDAKEPPQARRWWRREGIYLSDVCLAVHLSPLVRHLAGEELRRAKDALYTYLRRVGQTALEHDYMRPVACVLSARTPAEAGSDAPLWRELKSWAADQDWHRGAFTLYVEDAAREAPCPRDARVPAVGEEPPADGASAERGGPDWRLADLLRPRVDPVVFEPDSFEERDEAWFAEALESRLANADLGEAARGLAGELAERLAALLRGAKRNRKDIPRLDERDGPHAEWKDRIVATARDLASGKAP